MNKQHFLKLLNMYAKVKINASFYESTKCEIEHEKATISIDISDKYFHALGAIHGSVYFKLLDDSSYFAAHSIVTDVFLLTTSFSTNILRPVSSGKITAIGKLRFKSNNIFVAESTLYDEDGKEIAFGTGNFSKSKKLLSPEIGYDL